MTEFDASSSQTRPLPRRRRLLVSAGVIGFLSCSGFDTVMQDEHWPFSAYMMYSRVKPNYKSKRYQLFGVYTDGRREELDDRNELLPFYQGGLHAAFLGLSHRREAKTLMRRLAQDVADRYEQRRAAGELNGPMFTSVQLCFRTWTLDPYLRNLDDPDSTHLVLEVVPNAPELSATRPVTLVERSSVVEKEEEDD